MKKVGEDLDFNVYLTSANIRLSIGNDHFTLSKQEANQMAVKLVLLAGHPASPTGNPDHPLAWDENSEFVKAYRQELNEFGDFS